MRYYFPMFAGFYNSMRPITETILRVISGATLMAHGWPKITDPLGATEMVSSIGFAPAGFWSIALSVTEFFGGLLLLLGLFTRLAALGTFILLAVAAYFHWVLLQQGWSGAEFALLWAAVNLFFVARGGGRYSLDGYRGREI